MPAHRSSPHSATAAWHRVRRLTGWLLATWFSITFGTIFFARELAQLTLFGWPISFYMAAQGLPLAYLIIILLYARRMRRLDANLDHAERQR